MTDPRKLAWLAAILLASATAWSQSTTTALRESSRQPSPSQVAQAIAEICPPSTIVRGPNGSVTGCRTCPPGTAFHGFFKNGPWGIEQATIGHFVSPASSSILIDGDGCEAHSENFGGTYVFSLEAGRPKLLRYNPGLLTRPCRGLRLRDGRDFLVCEGEWTAQGYKSRYVYSVVFGPGGKGRHTVLFMTHDTVGMCGESVYGKPVGPVQRSRILSVRFPDINGDGLPDLSITATLGRKRFSVAQQKACEIPPMNYTPPAIPVHTYRIHYLFDGLGFRPTSASRKILKLFDRLPRNR